MSDNKAKKQEPTERLAMKDQDRQRCEIWTRVMGYHRPISSFNIGKKGEYYERRFFSEDKASASKAFV